MTDYGDCAPGCPICKGIGLVPCDEGWRVCSNNPKRFYQTGISENDAQLWRVLPKSKLVDRIMEVLGAALDARTGFIFLHGTPGIGKSVCARAYAYEAVQAGMKTIYTRQSELINHLRTSYDTEHGQEEYESRIRHYKNAEWLVIDELGRDRMTDFAQESLAEIVDARYTSSLNRSKVTVLISNFAPEEVFQPYLVDRIRDAKNKVLSLQGSSLRRTKND